MATARTREGEVVTVKGSGYYVDLKTGRAEACDPDGVGETERYATSRGYFDAAERCLNRSMVELSAAVLHDKKGEVEDARFCRARAGVARDLAALFEQLARREVGKLTTVSPEPCTASR